MRFTTMMNAHPGFKSQIPEEKKMTQRKRRGSSNRVWRLPLSATEHLEVQSSLMSLFVHLHSSGKVVAVRTVPVDARFEEMAATILDLLGCPEIPNARNH